MPPLSCLMDKLVKLVCPSDNLMVACGSFTFSRPTGGLGEAASPLEEAVKRFGYLDS